MKITTFKYKRFNKMSMRDCLKKNSKLWNGCSTSISSLANQLFQGLIFSLNNFHINFHTKNNACVGMIKS